MNNEQIKNAVRDIVGLLEQLAERFTEKSGLSLVITTAHHVSKNSEDFWNIAVTAFRGEIFYEENVFVDTIYVSGLTVQKEIEDFLNRVQSFTMNQ